MKLILAGSPALVLPTFERLFKKHAILAVVTQPDQKRGRGLRLQATPIATWALKNRIKVFKPVRVLDVYDQLKALDYDLLLTFAYGQILPTPVLKLGKFPPLNIHGSLLPKYRGAAPIHHALLNGDLEIGISLIKMIRQMDAGPVYFQSSQAINEDINYDVAQTIISKLACDHICDWLEKVETKDVTPARQEENFTLAPKIAKSFGHITSDLSLGEAKRRIRALTSIPGAFAIINNVRYKLFDYTNDYIQGCLELKLKNGTLFINDFQRAGKKRQQFK